MKGFWAWLLIESVALVAVTAYAGSFVGFLLLLALFVRLHASLLVFVAWPPLVGALVWLAYQAALGPVALCRQRISAVPGL